MMHIWITVLFIGLFKFDNVEAQGSSGLRFGVVSPNITVQAVLPVNTVIIQSFNVTTSSPSSELIRVTCNATLSTPGACDTFTLTTMNQDSTQWIGRLVLNQALNVLVVPSYLLVLQASNNVSIVTQNLQITVVDKVPPVFISSLSKTINEITDSSQSIIMQLTAVDGDSTQHRAIKYYLMNSSPGFNYFTIDADSGILFNKGNLTLQDPNWSLGFMTISVEAVVVFNSTYIPVDDPKSSTVANVVITLTPTETAPQFSIPSFNVQMREKSPNGSVVPGINIVVTSSNQGAAAYFELFLDNYPNVFYINPTNGSRSVSANLLVYNSTRLDYDLGQPYYSFNVIARNLLTSRHLSSSTKINISLTDIEDHIPVFVQQNYSGSVSELAPGYTSILTVLATDLDKSSLYGNASIRYKLSSTTKFRINAVTGQVSVAPCSTPGSGSCIDYEQQMVYDLTVTAADLYGDGTPVQALLRIYINNENDNPPVFQLKQYYGTILEYAPTLSAPLQLQATDADGNVISYKWESSTNGLWTIGPSTGVVNNTRPLTITDTPGHQGFFLYTASATDGKYTDYATVTITVVPVNKYTPVFTQNGSYEMSIPSNLPAGTKITTLTATDQDSPYTPNGQVTYRISDGSKDQFYINETTGDVMIKSGATLTDATYNITVVASDLGTPRKETTTQVIIHTLPPSYDRPVFVPSTIAVNVPDSTPIGATVGNISAYDSSPNATLVYRLIEPITGLDINNQPVSLTDAQKKMFVLDPTTGLLTLNGTLNRDVLKTWRAVVTATDTSSQPPKTATGTIVATVTSQNRPPVFVAPWTPASPFYAVSIQERMPADTFVTLMQASDPNGNVVLYNITSSSPPDTFTIDQTSGVVRLSNVLSTDSSRPETSFVVIAYDDGQPPLTSTATVNVTLTPQNMNAPVFNQSAYTVSILENSPAGTPVMQLYASFPNSANFGEVRYSLVDSFKGYFSIDPITGVITVAPGAVFNYADLKSMPLFASAYNNASDPSQQRTSYATINVNLIPVNAHSPTFALPSYIATISDSTPSGQIVVKVIATDVDSGDNGRVSYTIQSASRQGLFNIDNSSGVITTAVPMAGLIGTYYLTVSAYDHGSPSRSTPVPVTIVVSNSPNLVPIWNQPPADGFVVYTPEDGPVGTPVYSINAISSSGLPTNSSPIVYSFTDTSYQPVQDFSIDPVNGTISIRGNLNYDVKPFYPLIVTALDTSNNQTINRFLWIAVTAINIPVFPEYTSPAPPSCCSVPYNFTVYANAKLGDIVSSVHASVVNRPTAPISYSFMNASASDLFTIDPQSGEIKVNAALITLTNKTYTFVVRATSNGNYAHYPVAGCSCSNRSDVFVNVQVTLPPGYRQLQFGYNSYNSCLSEDSQIDDVIGFFTVNYPTGVVYSIVSVVAFYDNGNKQSLPNSFVRLLSNNTGTTMYLNSLVDKYIHSYIDIKLSATGNCSSTCGDQNTSTTEIKVWITQPRYQILVTTDTNVDDVTNNKLDSILSMIKSNIDPVNTLVCLSTVKYHVGTEDEPNYGQQDYSKTDLFMYIVNGKTGTLLTDFHVLDSAYSVDERIATGVIGITAANPYWASFNYVPIAAAIGIIIGLLLLAMLLLCCCVCWVSIAAWCAGCCVEEKEPLIYQDTTKVQSVIPVPVAFENLMTRRLLEDQHVTMGIGGHDNLDYDGMATAYATGRGYDTGDGDIFATAERENRSHVSRSRGSRSVGDFSDVHIVAPLAAPPGITYDVVDAPAPAVDNTSAANLVSTQETTTHYEERRFNADDHLRGGHSVSDMGAPSASVGGFSGLDPNRSPLGGHAPPESVSQSAVTLNDAPRNTSARIGATLYTAPDPHSGFAPTQNVVSAASYPTDDRRGRVVYDSGTATMNVPMSSLSLQQEIVYNDMPPRSSVMFDYDDYDQFVGGQPQRPPHADDMYQGEIRLGTASQQQQPRQLNTNTRFSEQETRFMM